MEDVHPGGGRLYLEMCVGQLDRLGPDHGDAGHRHGPQLTGSWGRS